MNKTRKQLLANQPAPDINTTSISGRPVVLESLRGSKVLIKFHRFSGCPVARHQIDDLLEHQGELDAANVKTIVFLHSTAAKVSPNFQEVPGLHIVADPGKTYYRKYQSRFSWAKLFSARSWVATFAAFGHRYLPQPTRFGGGIVGVPSDFIVDENGIVVDLHYGKHFGDSWTAADVLSRLTAAPQPDQNLTRR